MYNKTVNCFGDAQSVLDYEKIKNRILENKIKQVCCSSGAFACVTELGDVIT
eukprot:UN21753